jgi:hypothetical protein
MSFDDTAVVSWRLLSSGIWRRVVRQEDIDILEKTDIYLPTLKMEASGTPVTSVFS